MSLRARRRIASFIAALVGVGSLQALTAVPAQAISYGTAMVTTQRMSQPTLNSTQYGWYGSGTKLALKCYVYGQSVKGYYSPWLPNGGWDNIWFLVTTVDGGNQGYVADVDVNTGTNNPAAVAPACGTTPPPSTGNLISPFAPGQRWYVCQGYNGAITHKGQPALDLTLNPNGIGPSGCTGDSNYSANRPVYAPVSGTLYQVSSAYGGVCINTPSGRSVYLGHMLNRRGNGAVSAGTQIGTVAPAGMAGNNGYAHVHLQAHAGTGCGASPKVAFDAAHGLRIRNSPDMTYNGTVNQWRGTAIYR